MRLPGRRPKEDTATHGNRTPGDSVRGLLMIGLTWTLAVTALVAVHPTRADDASGPRPTFTILTVDGIPVSADEDEVEAFTVDQDTVEIQIRVLRPVVMDCRNVETDDQDVVATSQRGRWTLEVPLQPGRNTVECLAAGLIREGRTFEITYEPGAGTSPGTGGATGPSASGEPDLFEIFAIDGRPAGDVEGRTFTVHQPTVRIDIDQRSTSTVSCQDYDAGWIWETEPRAAPQYLDIDLVAGSNDIICRSVGRPAQEVRFQVEFVVDETPSADPDAVVITTVDGRARNEIPAHGYTTWSSQIIVRGTAPDPGSVVCMGDACEGQAVHATGATTWAVQLELVEGTNRVEVHAADDRSNGDRITIELVP